MRKRNTVKKLNRVTSHRKAMMRNMATSLFEHERIVTTRARSKVLRAYAEKLITRAKDNLDQGIAPEKALHNKREVMRHIADHDIVAKLFTDIAPRFKDRSGGYTRIIHLPERLSDASQMSIIELVDRKEKERKPRASRVRAAVATGAGSGSVEKAEGRERKPASAKSEKEKWFSRFMKKKKGE